MHDSTEPSNKSHKRCLKITTAIPKGDSGSPKKDQAMPSYTMAMYKAAPYDKLLQNAILTFKT